VLTERQHQVAQAAALGLTARQVADQVSLSKRTVSNHLYRIYRAVGVRDRSGLAEAYLEPATGPGPPLTARR